MNAAVAETTADPQQAPVAAMAAAAPAPANDAGADPIMEEVQLGFDRLRVLSHTELRDVINRRVDMLEHVLRQREERRAAIQTAKLASAMLELRRERALRIRRRVDYGSAIAAVASTILIIVVMI